MQSGSFYVPRGHAGVSAQPHAYQQQQQQAVAPSSSSSSFAGSASASSATATPVTPASSHGAIRATPRIVARTVPKMLDASSVAKTNNSRQTPEQNHSGTHTPSEEDECSEKGDSGSGYNENREVSSQIQGGGGGGGGVDTRLADRLNQVSNLLKGFADSASSQLNTQSTALATPLSAVSGRSTTPMSYQFARRAAQNGSVDARSPNPTGMRATSAGVVDSPTDAVGTGAGIAPRIALPYKSLEPPNAARPNYYRAPVPLPQKQQDDESTLTLGGQPQVHLQQPPSGHGDGSALPTARALPAAVRPARLRESPATESLSIDTRIGTPAYQPGRPSSALSSNGSHSSGNNSVGAAPSSSTKSAPLSAAVFLNSLRKPLPSVGTVGEQPSPSNKFESFSPSPSPHSYSVGGRGAIAVNAGPLQQQQQHQQPQLLPARGKFSHPH